VPAQDIPVPRSLSPQARAFLVSATRRLAALSAAGESAPSQAEQADAAVQYMRPAASRFIGQFETITLPTGASLYRATPEGLDGRKAQVSYFDIHGGAFVVGGGEMCQLLAKLRSMNYGIEIYSVDYRLLPDHPYPAALDDCLAAYRVVLGNRKPQDLFVAGSSAGGNLAAAMLLRARDEGLPMPAGLALMTPGLDLTGASDSFHTNRFLDVNLYGGGEEALGRYVSGSDPADPYLSPLYGDFSRGWPPTILTSGTRDLLLSDTVRMHRALRQAGITAELQVQEAGPHGGFMGQAPEDHAILEECRLFLYRTLAIG
jgi:acetyl esterase/lipase